MKIPRVFWLNNNEKKILFASWNFHSSVCIVDIYAATKYDGVYILLIHYDAVSLQYYYYYF